MVHKYTIDKTDIHDLLIGKEIPLALSFGKARAFKVEIADKMTNGDMMEAIFPDAEIEKWNEYSTVRVWFGVEGSANFTMDWWNTPIKTESEE